MQPQVSTSQPFNYFLQVVQQLLEQEEIFLYGNILTITDDHLNETGEYLRQYYQKEKIEYPGTSPEFDVHAAIWGARTLYMSAQLVLYRQTTEGDIKELFPAFEGEITPGSVLSADLCLRFIPDILQQLKYIDPEDGLIALLENILHIWHYSGVQYPLDVSNLNFDTIHANACIKQMYADRIIEHKRMDLATHGDWKEIIKGNLSIYAEMYWKEFKKETTYEINEC